jgi:hypothetical protein
MSKKHNKNQESGNMAETCRANFIAPHEGNPPIVDVESTCEYIRAITGEMSLLASQNGISVLSHLLDLTSAEASAVKARLRNAKTRRSTTTAH